VLAESIDVYNTLKIKEREAAEENNAVSSSDLRYEQMALEAVYKKDTGDLIDFLDTYFPPHPVDVSFFIVDI
jgi:hypothetical protein